VARFVFLFYIFFAGNNSRGLNRQPFFLSSAAGLLEGNFLLLFLEGIVR